MSVRAVSVMVLTVALVAGCTSKHHASSPSDSSGTPGVKDPRASAVLSGYDAYWAAIISTGRAPKASTAALAAHAVGVELSRAQAVIAQHRTANEYVTGSYGHKAVVVAITATTATVSDCLTVKTSVFDAKTKRSKANSAPGPFALNTAMLLDHGTWKVSEITPTNSQCLFPAPPPSGPLTRSSTRSS
jgi:hypothetical protein